MKKLIYLMLVISLTFAFGCNNDDGTSSNNTTNNDTLLYPGYEEFTTESDDSLEKDSTVVELDTVKEPEVNDNVMVEDNKGQPVVANSEDLNDKTKNFYIIVGSYQKNANAKQRMEYFKKIGYTAEVLPKFGTYERVSIASFNNEASARKELKALRTKFKDPSYWLLYR